MTNQRQTNPLFYIIYYHIIQKTDEAGEAALDPQLQQNANNCLNVSSSSSDSVSNNSFNRDNVYDDFLSC